jgi:hypothetical protein
VADLITLEEFKSYLGPDVKKSSQNDTELSAHVASASDWVRDEINRDMDERAYTEVLDGNNQQMIQLAHEPIKLSVVPVVVENGVALVVAFGFSSSADVVVKPGTLAPRESAYLARVMGPSAPITPAYAQPGRWAPGFQNITVTYTAGFDAASMPPAIKGLTKYIAARFWKEADRKEIGIARRATGGRSVDYAKDLPDPYKTTIANWKKYT